MIYKGLEIVVNSENIFRVKFSDSYYLKYLLDEDLMPAISSNHKSKILNFKSETEAKAAVDRYYALRHVAAFKIYEAEPEVSDTFRPFEENQMKKKLAHIYFCSSGISLTVGLGYFLFRYGGIEAFTFVFGGFFFLLSLIYAALIITE